MSTDTTDHTGSPDAGTAAPADAAERASIADHASRGIELAQERQARRDAGEAVPDLPDVASLPRDRDGLLTIRPSAKAPAAPDASARDRATPAADTSSVTPAPAPAAATQVPAQWSEAKKADFGRLAPDAQKLVLQHTAEQDAEHARRTEELSGIAERAQPFLSTYAQHREFLDAQSGRIGVPADEIMGNLVTCLRQGTTGQPQERAAAAAFVLNLFGVDPRSLPSLGQGQPADPVSQQLASIRQQQAEYGRFMEQTQRERHQQQLATGQRSIDDFASAKGEDGQLRYPHFQAVRALMAPHVERGASIEQAYRIAAKPIEDAVAAGMAARPAPAVAKVPTAAASGTRAPARSGRPNGARSGAPASRDIGEIAREGMRRAGFELN